ncbi:MAG: ABC transporter permease subunit [Spirochaetaceae bacterium]|nr:ABC transporter permease subunit [Spirochaetaceae bacterium]
MTENIILSPIVISLFTLIISGFFVFFGGIFVAFVVGKIKSPRIRNLTDALITLGMVLPPTVMGFFLLVIFGPDSLPGKFFFRIFGFNPAFSAVAPIITAFFAAFPLMYRSLRAGFSQVDSCLIDAARVVGETETGILWKIIVPTCKNSVIAGISLAMMRALGEYGATAMFAGNIIGKTRTLPLAVYSAVMSGDFKVAGIYVLVILSFALISTLLVGRESYK